MSGPKCATPVYVSNAERERRARAEAEAAAAAAAARLAEARAEAARLEAARTNAVSAAERLSAARGDAPAAARGAALAIPANASAEQLLRFVRDAEAEVEKIAARTRLLAAMDDLQAENRKAGPGVKLDTAPPGRARSAVRAQAQDERSARLGKLREMLSDVPGDTRALIAVGTAWANEADPHLRERRRSELLTMIEAQLHQAKRNADAVRDADMLLMQIGGIAGDAADALRDDLRRAARRGAIPAELRDRARALDSEDRTAHINGVVGRVLAAHQVDDADFATAFAEPGEWIPLDVPDAFARVIRDSTEIRFEPVRLPTCSATDNEVQRAYHRVLDRIAADAKRDGVDIHATRISVVEPPVRQIERREHRDARDRIQAPLVRKPGDPA